MFDVPARSSAGDAALAPSSYRRTLPASRVRVQGAAFSSAEVDTHGNRRSPLGSRTVIRTMLSVVCSSFDSGQTPKQDHTSAECHNRALAYFCKADRCGHKVVEGTQLLVKHGWPLFLRVNERAVRTWRYRLTQRRRAIWIPFRLGNSAATYV